MFYHVTITFGIYTSLITSFIENINLQGHELGETHKSYLSNRECLDQTADEAVSSCRKSKLYEAIMCVNSKVKPAGLLISST